MNIVKRTLLVFAFILIIIQLFRPARNVSSVDSVNKFHTSYAVPTDVERILTTSCYDCHSNNTRYPWYVYIQPIGWILDSHIKEGKSNLNFSEFVNYTYNQQQHKLDELIENVSDGRMPLPSYLIFHTDAKLSVTQKEKLIDWTVAMKDSMQARQPAGDLQ